MTFQYQFPAIAEPEPFGLQLQHVRDEATEAVQAYYEELPPEEVAMELMDVIHAAETALRQLGMSDSELASVRMGVVVKNERRGYYAPKEDK